MTGAAGLGPGQRQSTTPAPGDVEHSAIRHPTFDDRLGHFYRTDGEHVAQQRGDTVGHQQIRLEGELREARADGGQVADRADQDLSVTAKGLGDGDGT